LPAPYGALQHLALQAGGYLVTRDHNHDAAGNLFALNDAAHGEAFSYGYDDLDRLTAVSGALTETHGYNQIDNLTQKNGVGP
jgi:YD repeat-containing protein